MASGVVTGEMTGVIMGEMMGEIKTAKVPVYGASEGLTGEMEAFLLNVLIFCQQFFVSI